MTLHEGMGPADPPVRADGALPSSSIDEDAAAGITGRSRDAMLPEGPHPAAERSSRSPTPSGEATPSGRRTPPPLPWLAWTPGERVVVRYRLDDGLHDALGTLVETALDHVVVDTRRGRIRVEASTMVTGKRVPPPPSFPTPADRA
ncbi:putative acetyltransferase [Actinomyces culturomici]|uniref:putative acetyltransferase n=1 Tax=Actinomyces culturomici TaxID=1926276 RepID=UPI000E20B7DF|nr:hypothetical protein [Actinomyces culturomici]